MNQMMRDVVVTGTGKRARVAGYDIAGKTGTTSDYRDAWFVGYTGGFVTAVWTGKDNNRPMKGVSGGGVPAGIWRSFMAQALPRLRAQAIPGGYATPPAQEPDAIGDLLSNLGIGGGDTPPAQTPAPEQKAPPPRLPEEVPY
jgi:penicillin-binding protein 1A